jgi:four helix bundle protein
VSRGYKELIVWQKGLSLAKHIYTLTETFPKSQQFVLSNQMQRAALSIPSNIAEGYNRQYTREYRQFLSIAYGSAAELETQIALAIELSYMSEMQSSFITEQLNEVSKMLHVMIHNLKEAA